MRQTDYKEDLTGCVFNRLTVIKFAGRFPTKKALNPLPVWECICECGNFINVMQNSLKTGNTKSCGCLKIELTREKGYKNKIHGKSNNNAYGSWVSMKRRCYSKADPRYKDYGGRGIEVCDRWLERCTGILNFLEDMGERPSKFHSIDRLDVNGSYCKENCKWATFSEQNKNKRKYKNSSKFGTGIYKKGNMYLSFYSDKYLGSFESVEEANEVRTAFTNIMENKNE